MQFETINLADIPQPTNDYSPIPAGDYVATIKDAELKITKSGTGQYIKLKLEVVAPSSTGRVLFSNLNIRNDNETAQNIGMAQLGSIMRAAAIASVSNPEQLVGTTIGIKVTIKEAQNGYEAQNEVKAYKPVGNAPVLAQSAAANVATKGTPPWAAKK
jgi:hypothetical protein